MSEPPTINQFLLKKIAELEKRIETLENKPAPIDYRTIPLGGSKSDIIHVDELKVLFKKLNEKDIENKKVKE